MTIKQFFSNKYKLSVFLILLLIALDVVIHKGLVRVMIPKNFISKTRALPDQACTGKLISVEKTWLKAINTPDLISRIPLHTAGFESDVYFDTVINGFKVYHDSSVITDVNFESLIKVYQQRKLSSSIWFDFKNLNKHNVEKALAYLKVLREQYKLQDKIIVESSSPEYLPAFSNASFFTSYYVPFFNPYNEGKAQVKAFLDSIASDYGRFLPCALSGYYFQYPALNQRLNGIPILTWRDRNKFSVIGYFFNRKLLLDPSIKVVLEPFQY